MLNTFKAFSRSLSIADLEYVFILFRVENDLSEEQFVARVHKNTPSAMSKYG